MSRKNFHLITAKETKLVIFHIIRTARKKNAFFIWKWKMKRNLHRPFFLLPLFKNLVFYLNNLQVWAKLVSLLESRITLYLEYNFVYEFSFLLHSILNDTPLKTFPEVTKVFIILEKLLPITNTYFPPQSKATLRILQNKMKSL